MNQKDLLILSHLRKDARMTLTNMSKATNVPISTIYDRIKMQENGLIKKHTTLIDFGKMGYNTRANVTLKVERENRDSVKDYLMKHPNTNSVYKVNNGFDFMVECVFRNVKDLEDFMEQLDQKFKVVDSKTYYIIDDIKREAFMANPQFLDLVS